MMLALEDLVGLSQVGPAEGFTEGGWFEDHSGQRFYVKRPADERQSWNELLALRLCALSGITVPDTRVIGGALVSQRIAGARTVSSPRQVSASVLSERRSWFAVEAWLADWDAPYNWLVADGRPVRIDLAGALTFRARGGAKPLGPDVPELRTMRDPCISPKGAELYGPASADELVAGIKMVERVDAAAIRLVVSDCRCDAEVADVLIARREVILDPSKAADLWS